MSEQTVMYGHADDVHLGVVMLTMGGALAMTPLRQRVPQPSEVDA